MKIAVTGGTGFIGRHFANYAGRKGWQVKLVSRIRTGVGLTSLLGDNTEVFPVGIDDSDRLSKVFEDCDVVVHLVGINREIGSQTYHHVHEQGTENVISAARTVGVKKLVYLSFLRARPNCGSAYHESKWAAEEMIRTSGISHVILKPGVVYGVGDHMLDHLSHAFYTFPIFGLVGFQKKMMAPLAVDDLAVVLTAAANDSRLADGTFSVKGPEELSLSDAVKRVALVVGKSPLFIRMPIWFHSLLARLCDATMKTPLVSRAQVRILSEGLIEPQPFASELPRDLLPTKAFTHEQIRAGLPEPGRFGIDDLKLPDHFRCGLCSSITRT